MLFSDIKNAVGECIIKIIRSHAWVYIEANKSLN